MTECLNAVGFIFDSVKTYIKKDKYSKYSKCNCQECNYLSETKSECVNPIYGFLSPCNKCTNNSQYKICIFKLKKEHFISSSLEIAINQDDAWELFKNNIIYQKNGNFIISVTSSNNNVHSFCANMIKAKKCNCCESVLLYFKYNIISLLSCYEQIVSLNIPPDVKINTYFPYSVSCANLSSNISYNLKSGDYKNVKFFYSQNYSFMLNK